MYHFRVIAWASQWTIALLLQIDFDRASQLLLERRLECACWNAFAANARLRFRQAGREGAGGRVVKRRRQGREGGRRCIFALRLAQVRA